MFFCEVDGSRGRGKDVWGWTAILGDVFRLVCARIMRSSPSLALRPWFHVFVQIVRISGARAVCTFLRSLGREAEVRSRRGAELKVLSAVETKAPVGFLVALSQGCLGMTEQMNVECSLICLCFLRLLARCLDILSASRTRLQTQLESRHADQTLKTKCPQSIPQHVDRMGVLCHFLPGH